MKKIISACMFVIVAFAALTTIQLFQIEDVKRGYHIEETAPSFKFYISDSQVDAQESLIFFEQLSHDYDANIFLTTINEQGDTVKSVVYQPGSFPYAQFGLPRKKLFNSAKNIYTSYSTGNKYLAGKIPVFTKRNRLLLQSLESYHAKQHTTANGSYTVVLDDLTVKKSILNRISKKFGLPVKQLKVATNGQSFSNYNRTMFSFTIVLGIAVLIFILVVIYLPLSKTYDIGVMKLNGWPSWQIFWRFAKAGFYIWMGTSLLADSMILILMANFPEHFIRNLLLGQLLILFLYFLAQGSAYLLIRQTTIADLVNNRFHFELGTVLSFGAKVVMTIATTVLLVQFSQTIDENLALYQQSQDWQQHGNVLIPERFYDPENDHSQATLTAVYQDLEKQANAMYIYNQTLNPRTSADQEVSEFDPKSSYRLMNVNPKYIQQKVPQLAPLLTDTSKTRLFLVPETYRHNKKVIKLIKDNQFSSLTDAEQAKTSIATVPIKLSYYDDQKRQISVFAYDPEIKQRLINPIFSIVTADSMTDMDQAMLGSTNIYSPIKVPITAKVNSRIKKIITQNKAEYMQFHFASLNAILGENLNQAKLGAGLIALILTIVFSLNLTSSVFLLMCQLKGEGRTLAIKKLLGIKFTERYRGFLMIVTALYAIQFLVVLMFGSSKLILAVVALLITLDMLISIVFVRRQESRNLPLMLKGDL